MDNDKYTPQKYMTKQEMQETTQYLLNHPLFMKQLPQNIQQNQHLLALQNIIYDQDPEKLAIHFNVIHNQQNKGNQLVNSHKQQYYLKQALKNYTQGINAQSPNNDINAKLHSNRAMLNIKFSKKVLKENYGHAIQDCKKALQYNPKLIKALYKWILCLTKLNKPQQAQLIYQKNRVQINQSQNKNEFVKLYSFIQAELAKKLKVKQDKLKLKNNYEIKLFCQKKGYKLGNKPDMPASYQVKQLLKINTIISNNNLYFPIIIYIPQFSQLEMITQANQNETILNFLNIMLKEHPIWDQKNIYRIEELKVFLQIDSKDGRKKIQQCEKSKRISDVLRFEGYIFRYCLEIYICSRLSGQFMDNFLNFYQKE